MRKFKKILVALAAASIIGLAIIGYLNADKVVAVVNGKKISEPVYRSYLWSTQKEFEGISPDIWDMEIEGKRAEDLAKETTLNAIVTSIIIKEKAKEYGIKLTKEEKQAAKEVAQSFVGDEENRLLLAKLGFTQKEIEQFMCDVTLRNRVMEKMGENYTASEDEIQKEMNAGREYYKKVRVKEIVISKNDENTFNPLPEDKIAEQEKLAHELLERVLAGESIEELAKQYSQDKYSRDLNAEEIYSSGQLYDEVEQKIFEWKEGEVYPEVLEDEYDYYVMKLEEKIPVDENVLRTDSLKRLKADFAATEIKELIGTAKVEKTEHYGGIQIVQIDEN